MAVWTNVWYNIRNTVIKSEGNDGAHEVCPALQAENRNLPEEVYLFIYL